MRIMYNWCQGLGDFRGEWIMMGQVMGNKRAVF